MKRSLIVGALVLVGCTKDEAKAPVAVAPTPAPVVAAAQAPAGELRGKVAEKLDAANYTYLRLTTATGDVWAAVPATEMAIGTEVTVGNPMPMKDFESKTLNRKFDVVMFGAVATPVGGAAQPAAAPTGNPHGDAAPTVAPGADEKVAKADGPDARTIAELFAQKAALADKTASVRGKVTKATSGVLGRTWLHLRDGSGTEGASDNDLTITTSQEGIAVGEVVTVKGVVHLDKDLGSGYAYPVIIEDATVTK